MVVTRPQAKAAFNHVLDNVLGRDDSSPLKQSLLKENVQDIFDLCSMEESTINVLCYDKSPTETDVDVSRTDKTLLRIVITYVGYLRTSGTNALTQATDWMALTQEDFDDFRITKYTPPLSQPSPIATSSTTATAPPSTKYTPAELFRRGIKRDPSLFPVLKEEKFNDTWHRSFVNQARAQDVIQVLDKAYVPSTAEDKDLFDEKQKYVYAILERTVLTDRGKTFVQAHETDYDVQKVYQKLVDHHLKSTKAASGYYFVLHYLRQTW